MDVTTAVGLLVLALVVGVYGTIIGAGGGFVLIPALVLLFDLEGVQAVGTGAVTLTVIGVTGALAHDKGGLVERQTAISFGVTAVPVALLCGWFVAGRIDSQAFTGVLAVLLLLLAAFVVFGPGMADVVGNPLPARRRPLAIAGAAVGAISGTFAVGGGLITVPTLSRLQNLGPHRAAATTQATAMFTSAAGATGHTFAGNVVWNHASILVLGAFVGSTVGAKVSGRLSPRTVLVLLAGGLIAAGVPLLVDAL